VPLPGRMRKGYASKYAGKSMTHPAKRVRIGGGRRGGGVRLLEVWGHRYGRPLAGRAKQEQKGRRNAASPKRCSCREANSSGKATNYRYWSRNTGGACSGINRAHEAR
jgi:hypothetical protein